MWHTLGTPAFPPNRASRSNNKQRKNKSKMSGPLNLSAPTAQAQTAVPMFVENQYVKVRFKDVGQDEVPDKGNVIKFTFETVDPAPNQDGGTILPGGFGSLIFVQVQDYDKNTPKGGPMPKWATEKLAKITDAFLGTGDVGNKKGKPPRPDFGPAIVPNLIGQVAFFKFKNKTGDFVGQDVSSFTFPGDVAGA